MINGLRAHGEHAPSGFCSPRDNSVAVYLIPERAQIIPADQSSDAGDSKKAPGGKQNYKTRRDV